MTSSPDQQPHSQTDDDLETPREETIQERSARLEAEAASGAFDPGTSISSSSGTENMDQVSSDQSLAMEALQKELDTAKDQAIRALAEAENTRKRAMRERQEAGRYAISSFARDLLEVSDNLGRALDAVPEDLAESDVRIKNLLDGIEATARTVFKVFEKNGIKKLESLGQPFDPNFHEVMFEAPGTGQPPGTIVQELEIGYVLNDRLLRPARVGVAKNDSDAQAPSASSPGGQIDTEV